LADEGWLGLRGKIITFGLLAKSEDVTGQVRAFVGTEYTSAGVYVGLDYTMCTYTYTVPDDATDLTLKIQAVDLAGGAFTLTVDDVWLVIGTEQPEFRPLTVSSQYNYQINGGAALGDGTSDTFDITVPGLRSSDNILIAASATMQGCFLQATYYSANTCRVRVQNETGAPVTFGSTYTWRITLVDRVR
jgi:hypothetical protein